MSRYAYDVYLVFRFVKEKTILGTQFSESRLAIRNPEACVDNTSAWMVCYSQRFEN